MSIVAIITILGVVADRITKNFAITLKSGESQTFIKNIISFTYVENRGAAFGIMQNARVFFVVITIVILIALIVYLLIKKPENVLLLSALGLITSGAVGNLIDRILFGYVIDFIQTDFIKFPVFNVADICVTIGVVLLMVYILFFDEKSKQNK